MHFSCRPQFGLILVISNGLLDGKRERKLYNPGEENGEEWEDHSHIVLQLQIPSFTLFILGSIKDLKSLA